MDVPGDRKKSQYGYRAVGGILGIVFLMTVLLFTGTFLSLSFGLPQQSFSMILVLFATALSIALAVRMGYRGMQDATIFFLTENDRLWVMDARGFQSWGWISGIRYQLHGNPGVFTQAGETAFSPKRSR